jgi:hypothetical protein
MKIRDEHSLVWPNGPRTRCRDHSYRFSQKVTFESARDKLASELWLAGASSVVLTYDLHFRGDPGVAVYFVRNGRRLVTRDRAARRQRDGGSGVQRIRRPAAAPCWQGNTAAALARRSSPSYSAGLEFELTGVAQSVELA